MIVAVGAISAGTVMPAAADTDLPEYLTKMRAQEMWKVADGTGITVAVIDSGVKDVPGLEGRVLPGVSFMEPPVNHPDQKYPPHDDFDGHGTTMTAAIVGDGSAGSPRGLAPGAKVMPIRTSIGTAMAFGAIGEASKGVRYAADNGAKIINLSIGGWWSFDKLRPAVEYAQSKGVLVFTAMGNEGAGNNSTNPIAILPGILGVGAVDINGDPMPLSSHGQDTDLASFGGKTPIRCKENTAWCMSDGGTSYATALASASAALVWSAHPDWTANQVARVLIQTAGAPRDGVKRNDYVGYGIPRPSKVLLDRAGDPGAPDVDPLDGPAPVKAATPSAGQTAAAAPRAESAAAKAGFSWQWPALGAVAAVCLGLGITVIVKRRRR
ncbi:MULTISPECIES: S8 family serine peptidase [unclassified Streptomyces]|uniref:S8 family serine peptidase n=1 Tax=unclassified Streptomyces TaxID=2593676 RepID=UPI002E29AB75|nr:S8 family serine peptidase [Streptomyces sp. NBC_01439]